MNHKYTCENCDFNTNNKTIYSKHLQSKKHKRHINIKIEYKYPCTSCSKKYNSRTSINLHKQKCQKQLVCSVIEESSINNNTSILDKKMEELKNLIIEMKDNQAPTTSTTNNNTNNNNININLILNENFKNAKNFIDMIREMKLDDIYHDNISSVDYVSDMFRMIKTEMEKLPFVERPIQCIKDEDDHQNILHIRHDNEWRKETELEWTQQIHNYYIDDGDEAPEDQEKIIFVGLKRMEDNIIEQIRKLYGHTYSCKDKQREYKYEMDHIPNKIRIIKCLLEYVNIDKDELLKILEVAYNEVKQQNNI
jgi:hypothetical protein